MIELRHVRKEFGSSVPIRDVSAVINDGDVISVIGPSGTGKSTLLRCINLLNRPTSGQIIVDGEDITAEGYDICKARQKMGMVFQAFNLFDHLTVIENIMIGPMELLHMSKKEAYKKGMKLLKDVGLADRALRYPDALSGGQKQRAAIARTLAMDPDIILLDEPTSALDPTMVGEVQSVIRELSKSGKTMMIVTHEMAFARSICNRVFYLDDGGIYEDGTPEQIFENPQKDKTRRFIRQLKVLEFSISDDNYDFHHLSSEIETFCTRNRISLSLSNSIRYVLEELCHQILMKELKHPVMNGNVEYDDESGRTAVTVTYRGELFDPRLSKNQLSLKILKGHTDHMKYTAEEETLLNTITMTIREKSSETQK